MPYSGARYPYRSGRYRRSTYGRRNYRYRPNTNRFVARTLTTGYQFRNAMSTNSRYKTGQSIPRGPWNSVRSIAPLKMPVKLNYYEGNTHTSPGVYGTAIDTLYSANGMWDPRYSVGGNQPRGFDEYMALYDDFVVLASKITVQFYPEIATNYIEPGIYGILVGSTNSTFSSMTDIMEHPTLRYKSPRTVYDNLLTIHNKVNVMQWFRVKDILANPDFLGTSAANPIQEIYYHVVSGPSQYGLNTGSYDPTFSVRIQYLAVFLNPKEPAAS